MGKADYVVYIGRFEPLHLAHIKVMEEALKEHGEKLIVLVGSMSVPCTPRNPWEFWEREDMIETYWRETNPEVLKRIIIEPIRDFKYNDINWLTSVQNTVMKIAKRGKTVKLIGHFKDDSSYYLKLFPQWELVRQPNYFGLNGSDIRDQYFRTGEVGDSVPANVATYMQDWKELPAYQTLVGEYQFLLGYKEQWKDAPHPPTFVTTDAVVVQAGHVLLIRRGRNPGKGMLALPGGFVGQDETILNAALRELKEETDILFPKDELKKCLKKVHVFDHPKRDARGRTITHAHFFHIEELGPLPEVSGGDDASEAVWVPLNDLPLLEKQFYSDHLHIISYFVNHL